jgi:hypothetical protein
MKYSRIATFIALCSSAAIAGAASEACSSSSASTTPQPDAGHSSGTGTGKPGSGSSPHNSGSGSSPGTSGTGSSAGSSTGSGSSAPVDAGSGTGTGTCKTSVTPGTYTISYTGADGGAYADGACFPAAPTTTTFPNDAGTGSPDACTTTVDPAACDETIACNKTLGEGITEQSTIVASVGASGGPDEHISITVTNADGGVVSACTFNATSTVAVAVDAGHDAT